MHIYRDEQTLAQALFEKLLASNFHVTHVDNGGGYELACTWPEVHSHTFAADEAWWAIRHASGRTYWIYLIPGNGPDLISDFNFKPGDPDGFAALIERFCDEIEAI